MANYLVHTFGRHDAADVCTVPVENQGFRWAEFRMRRRMNGEVMGFLGL